MYFGSIQKNAVVPFRIDIQLNLILEQTCLLNYTSGIISPIIRTLFDICSVQSEADVYAS